MLLVIATAKVVALFGHVAADRDRKQQDEQQVVQEQQSNRHLHFAGSIVALVTGAAVGSKAKEDYEA